MEKKYIAYETGPAFLVGCVGTFVWTFGVGVLIFLILPPLGVVPMFVIAVLIALPLPVLAGRIDRRLRDRANRA